MLQIDPHAKNVGAGRLLISASLRRRNFDVSSRCRMLAVIGKCSARSISY